MSAAAVTSLASRAGYRAMAPVATELTLQCSDGIRIAAQSWKQPTHSDAVVNANGNASSGSNSTPSHRILCLHGWMDNAASFHILAPALVNRFPTVELIALDFPGHGLSSHKSMDGPPAILAECVYYVAEALEQLQWNQESTPFTLIGHSMGASVSALYAAAFPEQVSKLILLEGAGPLARNPRDVAKHVRAHVNRRQIANQAAKQPRVYPDLDTAVQTRCRTAQNFPGNQWLSTAAATEMVLRGSRPVESGTGTGTGGLQFRHDPRLQWPSLQYFSYEQTEAVYQDIQCPTALVLADDGWPFDDGALERMLGLLQPAFTEKLPGSHHFHADPETADSVTAAVLSFLEQQQQQQPAVTPRTTTPQSQASVTPSIHLPK
jgi:pimeloyl-ACP methyl ester carboxylesterase